MTKIKLFADPEKEEKWLDEMSDRGYILRSVNPSFGIYRFDSNPDKQFNPKTRVDFRCLPTGNKCAYLEMFELSGWKNIYSSGFTNQHYFVQSEPTASDEIFSDTASLSDRYSRIGSYSIAIGVFCTLVNLLSMLIPGSFDYIGLLAVTCICAGIGVALIASGITSFIKVIRSETETPVLQKVIRQSKTSHL